MTYRVAIITVSDRSSRGEREDLSGPVLKRLAEGKGFKITSCQIVPDDINNFKQTISTIADNGDADLILTTGGTGLSARDVTPEATRSVIEKHVPGIPELIRSESAKITRRAYLSRGIAGTRGKTLIINLPGSPKGAAESFEIIYPVLEHALDVLIGISTNCGR